MIYGQPPARDESRSFHSNGFYGPNSLFNNDYTRDNTNESTELENNIRLASLHLVARNLIKDMFIQRFSAIGRFFKLATNTFWQN